MSLTTQVTAITPTLRRQCGPGLPRLRLPTIRGVLDEVLTVAGKEQLFYQGFLAELVLAQCDDRDRRSIRRVKAANFPGQGARGL